MSDFSLTAAGGNSSAARSARARLQWRDRYGRWIEMGRGIKFKVHLDSGATVSVNGRFVGAKTDKIGQVYVINDPNGLRDGFYDVSSANAQEILASIDPADLAKQGIEVGKDASGNPVGERLDSDIPNQSELTVSDRPIGWVKNKNGTSQTDDGAFTAPRRRADLAEQDGKKFSVFHRGKQVSEAEDWPEVVAIVNKIDAEGGSDAIQETVVPEPDAPVAKSPEAAPAKNFSPVSGDPKTQAKAAVADYDDENGTLADLIDSGASKDEVLAKMDEISPKWVEDQGEAEAGANKERPSKAEKAWMEGQRQRRLAIASLDAPEDADEAPTPAPDAPEDAPEGPSGLGQYDPDGRIQQMIDSGTSKDEILAELGQDISFKAAWDDYSTRNDVENPSEADQNRWAAFEPVANAIEGVQAPEAQNTPEMPENQENTPEIAPETAQNTPAPTEMDALGEPIPNNLEDLRVRVSQLERRQRRARPEDGEELEDAIDQVKAKLEVAEKDPNFPQKPEPTPEAEETPAEEPVSAPEAPAAEEDVFDPDEEVPAEEESDYDIDSDPELQAYLDDLDEDIAEAEPTGPEAPEEEGVAGGFVTGDEVNWRDNSGKLRKGEVLSVEPDGSINYKPLDIRRGAPDRLKLSPDTAVFSPGTESGHPTPPNKGEEAGGWVAAENGTPTMAEIQAAPAGAVVRNNRRGQEWFKAEDGNWYDAKGTNDRDINAMREFENLISLKSLKAQLPPTPAAEESPESEVNPWDASGPSAAEVHDALDDMDITPEVQASYDALTNSIVDQYRQMRDEGINITFSQDDPYESSADMLADVQNNKNLSVFADGGATLPEGHPMKRTVNVDGEDFILNDLFRGVHDYFGHVKSLDRGAVVGFGPKGEWEAWRTHRLTLPRESWQALWLETRGQNAWTNYNGDNGNLPIPERPYADQKVAPVSEDQWAADLTGDETDLPLSPDAVGTPDTSDEERVRAEDEAYLQELRDQLAGGPEAGPDPNPAPEREPEPVAVEEMSEAELSEYIEELRGRVPEESADEFEINEQLAEARHQQAINSAVAEAGDDPEEPTAAEVLPEAPGANHDLITFEDEDSDYEGEKFLPTDEQRNIIKSVLSGLNVAVQALAGTGKTSTLELLAKQVKKNFPDKRIVYIAFNKTVQLEADSRMPGNVESRTGDSLGYHGISADLRKKLNKGHALPADVAQDLNLRDMNIDGTKYDREDVALGLMRAIEKFSISDSDNITADHFDSDIIPGNPETVALAERLWADITSADGVTKFTNSHATKIWALSKPDLSKAIPGGKKFKQADMIFFDEAQDINPVMAKIVRDQTAQKIYVGDGRQAIYGFRGAENELDNVSVDITLPLTKSFRFGEAIAGMGNRALSLLNSPFKITGAGPEGEVLRSGTMTDADVVLTRSNVGAIEAIIQELQAGRKVGVSEAYKREIQSIIDSVRWLQSGGAWKRPWNFYPDLDGYKKWEKLEADVKSGKASGKANTVFNLINKFQTGGLQNAIENVIITDRKDAGAEGLPDVDLSDGASGKFAGATIYSTERDGDNVTVRVKGWGGADGNARLKAAGFRFQGKDPKNKHWAWSGSVEDAPAAMRTGRGQSAGDVDESPDVIVTTAHKSKGLEWNRVRIGGDFKGPEVIVDEETGEERTIFPSPEEIRLAYVALTRAIEAIDPGSLDWVKNYTQTDDEDPNTPSRGLPDSEIDALPEEQEVSEPEEQEQEPEAPETPEPVEEVAPEPEPEPEPTPEPEPVVEPTPVEEVQPEPTPEPVQEVVPEPEPAPTPEPVIRDEVAPEPQIDDDGLPDNIPDLERLAVRLERRAMDLEGKPGEKRVLDQLDRIYEKMERLEGGEDSGDGMPPEVLADPVVPTVDPAKRAVAKSYVEGKDIAPGRKSEIDDRLNDPEVPAEEVEQIIDELREVPNLPNTATKARPDVPEFDVEAVEAENNPNNLIDGNLVMDAVRRDFPNHIELPNGDLAIETRTVKNKKYDLIVRRTKRERFYTYIQETDLATGKARALRVGPEGHSYKALQTRIRLAEDDLNRANPGFWMNRNKNRVEDLPVDANGNRLFPQDDLDNLIDGTDMPRTSDEIRNILIQTIAEKLDSPTDLQRLKGLKGVGADLIEAVRESVGRRKILDEREAAEAAVLDEIGNKPTHVAYGGEQVIQPGQIVEWTQWRRNKPDYGRVYRGIVTSLQDRAISRKANGEYEYSDSVLVQFPELDAKARLINPKAKNKKSYPRISSGLRIVDDPREPIGRPFFAKEEELGQQENVLKASDFGVPPNPTPGNNKVVRRPAPAKPKKVEPVIDGAGNGFIEADASKMVNIPLSEEGLTLQMAEAQRQAAWPGDIIDGDIIPEIYDGKLSYVKVISATKGVNGETRLNIVRYRGNQFEFTDITLTHANGFFDIYRPKKKIEIVEGDAAKPVQPERVEKPEGLGDVAAVADLLPADDAFHVKQGIAAAENAPKPEPEDPYNGSDVKNIDWAEFQNMIDTKQLDYSVKIDHRRVKVGDIFLEEEGDGGVKLYKQIIGKTRDGRYHLRVLADPEDRWARLHGREETVRRLARFRESSVFGHYRPSERVQDDYFKVAPTPEPETSDRNVTPISKDSIAQWAEKIRNIYEDDHEVVQRIHKGAMNLEAKIIELKSGKRLFIKKVRSRDFNKEIMSNMVANAFGLNQINMIGLDDDETLVMDIAPGVEATEDRTLADLIEINPEQYPTARLMGLLDIVIQNSDRHRGNWFVTEEGPIPIDHGLAWSSHWESDSPFAAYVWSDPYAFTKSELRVLRANVEALIEEFSERGMIAQWTSSIQRIDRLIESMTKE